MKEEKNSQRFDKCNSKNAGIWNMENTGLSFIQDCNIGLSHFRKF